MTKRDQIIAKELLSFGEQIDPKELFPSLEPGATDFILSNPYAFALAVCLDRGTKADIIWTLPYYLRQEMGHLDPIRINQLSQDELGQVFLRLPRRPRYIDAAPRTVKELTELVLSQFNGDASHIWLNKRAAQVKATFRSIYGVGEGIANMAVLLIEKAYSIRFSDLDRPMMDIKADVHTMRVLYRLGVSAEESSDIAMAAARRLNPSYPGELDAPLWVIGRRWCTKHNPKCCYCYLFGTCFQIGISKRGSFT